jgi:Protein of unknown function (DUF4079)
MCATSTAVVKSLSYTTHYSLLPLPLPPLPLVSSTILPADTRRKELTTKNVRDKHYETGSIILGLGTFAAIEGPVNTYIRAGKVCLNLCYMHAQMITSTF